MPAYDEAEIPPAPIASVTWASPAAPDRKAETRALIDSGAAVTVAPPDVFLALGVKSIGWLEATGYQGEAERHQVFEVSLEIEGHLLPLLRVAEAEVDEAIIGRDVLNRFILTLNGPALTFDLSAP